MPGLKPSAEHLKSAGKSLKKTRTFFLRRKKEIRRMQGKQHYRVLVELETTTATKRHQTSWSFGSTSWVYDLSCRITVVTRQGRYRTTCYSQTPRARDSDEIFRQHGRKMWRKFGEKFVDVHPDFREKCGCTKLPEKSSTNSARHEEKLFHPETLIGLPNTCWLMIVVAEDQGWSRKRCVKYGRGGGVRSSTALL